MAELTLVGVGSDHYPSALHELGYRSLMECEPGGRRATSSRKSSPARLQSPDAPDPDPVAPRPSTRSPPRHSTIALPSVPYSRPSAEAAHQVLVPVAPRRR